MRRLLLGALVALAACTAPEGGPLVVVGATLIDGTGKPPLQDAFIVIEGDHIKAVGHQSRVPLPKGARVVDARGKFIVPRLGSLTPAVAVQTLAERMRAGVAPVQAIAELAAGRTIEPGQPADLLLLDRDPLLNPANLASVVQVIALGRPDPAR